MDERDADRIVNRLLQIERRLEEMDRRLSFVEGSPAVAEPTAPHTEISATLHPDQLPHAQVPVAAPQAPTAPPVLQGWDIPRQPPPPAALPNAWDTATQRVPPTGELTPPNKPPDGKTPSLSGDDLEYKIGRIGLLWAGAVVVVIGIIYLVALAAAHTTATPQMRFAGDLAFSMAFIVVGFIKRNEREEFGQILTGIGSFGLYASFAAGHVYLKLYSSEVAVALFVALSLANLSYAAWRSSRSFLALGMIGGLVAAMLPMHEYNAPLDVVLHFVILVPCAMIIARNKFIDMASWLWVASTLALLPIYTYTNHLWLLRVGALYSDALMCAALYGYVHRDWKFDPKCTLPFAVIAFAGIGGVAIEGVRNGSLHVCALAAAAAAVGWVLRERTLARNSLYGGALAVAVALAPMGYTRAEAAITFAVLSIALSIVSLRVAPMMLRGLAYVELALATCAYLGVWMVAPPLLPFGSEVAVLVAMMAAVVTGAVCAVRSGLPPEGAIAIGAALTLPLFERFGNLFLTAPSVGAPFYVSAFFTTLAGFSIMYALARWRPYVAPVVACWLLYLLSICAYLACATSGGFGFSVDLSMVGCLVVVGLLQAYLAAPKLQGPDFDIAIFASGAMVGLYVVRLSYLLLTHYSNFSLSSTIVVGAAVWTLVAAGLHRRLKLMALMVVGWAGLAVLLWALWPMSQWEETGVKYEAALSLVGLVCILAVGDVTCKAAKPESRELAIGVFGLIAGGTWIRFVFIVLTQHVRIHNSAIANSPAFAIGALLCFMAAAGVFYWRRENVMVPLAWVAGALFLGDVIPLASMLGVDHGGLRFETPMLILALGVPLLLVRMTSTLTKERMILTAVPIILNWMSFTRLCLHVARVPSESANAVVSLVWTAFAAILISLGFGYRAQFVRYWALGVFGITLAKVFLIDLANVEAAIRVAILLFLGLCMVGAGYGYVRWKKNADAARGVSPG